MDDNAPKLTNQAENTEVLWLVRRESFAQNILEANYCAPGSTSAH